MDDIDLILANLEYSFASVGGICVGDSYVVDRQTLAASGYCFTTSQPPLLTAGIIKSLEMLENNSRMTIGLQENSRLIHQSLSKLKVPNKNSWD